ncbi:MAG: hypothetical protein N3H31_00505 [Candidatus Nezhaarchaeota archaeon]|nr:hypothetical protein [Candidatus Nezhaarchaeota archaeon]
MQAVNEALSIVDQLLSHRDLFFSRGYLNSEGRKLVAKLLRLLAEADPKSFRKLKKLYPEAPEDRWAQAVEEVRGELLALSRQLSNVMGRRPAHRSHYS